MTANRRIPYVDLAAQYREERAELLAVVERVLAGGSYIGGTEIEALEQEFAKLCETREAVALNSGTDALFLGLRALGIGPGDEVITPPNSFVASTGAIVQVGATPVFVDVQADQNVDPAKVAAAVTKRTRAIMPVHLTGRICDMDPILEIARRHGLAVIEDAAQAIGSRYHGKPSGSFGEIGCFSCHPLKNLNACGDAGFVVTNDAKLAQTIRSLRNHGLAGRDSVDQFGLVSRMDTLQAAILRYRVSRLPSIVERRRKHVALYRKLLHPAAFNPPELPDEFIAYHTFVIQTDRRDELKAHLAANGIETAIHYPVPIHLQPAAARLGYGRGAFPVCERQAGRILTLPIHPWLSESDVAAVAQTTNQFLADNRCPLAQGA
ncbi:MAG: DegT/DnrJ/EryC1/StrS family aminotransferase [Alphaproteobacteria bacterium]|nr:DegT/DnrJ/EryC1/StrS family aminotransferase [Alphaproteobacteria bacterium]